MINIVLADDHRVIRKGLLTLLSSEPDFKIIGEAVDGPETVKLVEQLKPTVLVLDLMMPGLNGLEVTRLLTKSVPDTAIVILSMQNGDAYVVEALHSGARAYVLKESPVQELVQAIREVSAGRRFLASALSNKSPSDDDITHSPNYLGSNEHLAAGR